MAIKNIIASLGGKFVKILSFIFSKDFLLGAGLTIGAKLLRWYGLIAFITTIGIAISVGIQQHSVLAGVMQMVKTVITVDQKIYDMSVDFSRIASPTLWQAIITLALVIKESFFYIWWHRAFCYLVRQYSWTFPMNLIVKKLGRDIDKLPINESTPKSEISWYAFLMLYIFLIFSNIGNMIFISKVITFNFVPITNLVGFGLVKAIATNLFHFIDRLLINQWWHWIIAFKGIGHYLLTGALFKTIGLFLGTKINFDFAWNITQNLTNTTG